MTIFLIGKLVMYYINQREWMPVDTGEGLSGDTPSFFFEKISEKIWIYQIKILYLYI